MLDMTDSLNGGLAQPTPVLRIGIEAHDGRLGSQRDVHEQLCVPPMGLKGDSYRLQDRDLGRVPTPATDEQ